MKWVDARELGDRMRLENESLRKETDKLRDAVRELKEEGNARYEQYSQQLSQSESQREEKLRQVGRENERMREETETWKKQEQQMRVGMHELEIKLDSYMRDYERYFDENKRLREVLNTLREEKETAWMEVNRMKLQHQQTVNELNEECNQRLAHLTQQLLDSKDRYMFHEKKATDIMIMQERIVEKWKTEHLVTVDYFTKTMSQLKHENKNYREKLVEVKGQLRLQKENEGADNGERKRKHSSKSKEKSKNL